MKIEYGDFTFELGWWGGLAVTFLVGILADAAVAIALGEPGVMTGNGVHIDMNATNQTGGTP